MENFPIKCTLLSLQCVNLLQSLYGQLAIFDMLNEHYGCEFYIGLLSLSYLVAYRQNYNHTIKVSAFLLHKFYHRVIPYQLNLHPIYVLSLEALYHIFESSLYYKRQNS